jgi:sugar-specific transcriptional regulator TrmB
MENVNFYLLKELGLTEAEINVYSALTKKGRLSASMLANETKLNRSNLYKVLSRLISQKLISEIIYKKIKYFSANNPSRIKEMLDNKIKDLKEKEGEIDKIVSFFKKQKPVEDSSEFSVQVFSGKEELKQVLAKMLSLKRGDITYALGIKGFFKEIFPEFWKNYKNQREIKGIKFRGVLDTGSMKPTKPHRKFTEVRYTSIPHMSHIRIDLYKDNLIFFITDPKDPKAIVIKNREMMAAMKSYFDLLWEKAQKV